MQNRWGFHSGGGGADPAHIPTPPLRTRETRGGEKSDSCAQNTGKALCFHPAARSAAAKIGFWVGNPWETIGNSVISAARSAAAKIQPS